MKYITVKNPRNQQGTLFGSMVVVHAGLWEDIISMIYSYVKNFGNKLLKKKLHLYYSEKFYLFLVQQRDGTTDSVATKLRINLKMCE